VLEVMNADGTHVHQISFNQSHDRDAIVLADGRVLWTRWDNAPGTDAMSLYSANPDGTDLELYYGANSHNTGTNNTVIEFTHPRQMQDGRILTIARQHTDVDDGGDLVIIDGALRGRHPGAARQPRLNGRRAAAGDAEHRVDHPGPIPGRPLHVRLSAAGRHGAHSRQLDTMPAA
jgi:hypothetical protein